MNRIRTGLEVLLENPPPWLSNKRLGLLCNPASVDHRLSHASALIGEKFGDRLKALFSPQHGLYAEKQDNMIESDDFLDPRLKIPVFSLYGKTRRPTEDMLKLIDVLIVDLVDVGTRVYTFLTTLSYCLEEAKKTGKTVLVLDRPNPTGGIQVEGNCLNPAFASFVGRYPVPMRHGLTIGEYASWINIHFSIGCDLVVIPMQGWKRGMLYEETGLYWVAPSPNLPSPASVLVYPGQVLWEGTNISEGRGTTQPFEIFGAPFIDTDKILSFMGGNRLKGCVLRPVVFEPTSNKWKNEPCRGFQIHVTDPYSFAPFETSLKLLAAVLFHHRDDFEWKSPPYEYEYETLPIDLIFGDSRIRKEIEAGVEVTDVLERGRPEIADFIESSMTFRLYD
jgi:uncharacterized protein YbbC (DUF1343 family)